MIRENLLKLYRLMQGGWMLDDLHQTGSLAWATISQNSIRTRTVRKFVIERDNPNDEWVEVPLDRGSYVRSSDGA